MIKRSIGSLSSSAPSSVSDDHCGLEDDAEKGLSLPKHDKLRSSSGKRPAMIGGDQDERAPRLSSTAAGLPSGFLPRLQQLSKHKGKNNRFVRHSVVFVVLFLFAFALVISLVFLGSPKFNFFKSSSFLSTDSKPEMAYPQSDTGIAQDASPADGRIVLPDCAKPDHYDLYLKADLDAFSFDGHVDISIEFLRDTDSVSVNANELDILSAHITIAGSASENKHEAINIDCDKKLEQTKFAFGRAFSKGTRATLTIKYKGIINDKLAGFYRSQYTDPSGQKK